MVLVLATLMILVPASAAASTSSPGSDGSSLASQGADVRNVQDAAKFRSEFGFASDDATISALLSDASTDFSFGAPLSPSELAKMKDRQALRESAEPVVAYVASRPNDFGGVYFTQEPHVQIMC